MKTVPSEKAPENVQQKTTEPQPKIQAINSSSEVNTTIPTTTQASDLNDHEADEREAIENEKELQKEYKDPIFSMEVTFLSKEHLLYIIDEELLRSLDNPVKVSLDLGGRTEVSVRLNQKILKNYQENCNDKQTHKDIGERLQCHIDRLVSSKQKICIPFKYNALLEHFPNSEHSE